MRPRHLFRSITARPPPPPAARRLVRVKGRRGCVALWVLLAGGFIFSGSLAKAAEPLVSREYQIKAAFLYNFIKFVEWPGASFADAKSPIVIGVLGSNPFGEELEKIVRDRKVNGRAITVVRLLSLARAASAHVVFVVEGEENGMEKYRLALAHARILLVGESARFAALDGMITFAMVGDKVRFEINMSAVDEGGLKMSSQLQKLATVVHRTP